MITTTLDSGRVIKARNFNERLLKGEEDERKERAAQTIIDTVQDYTLVAPRLIELCELHPQTSNFHSRLATRAGAVVLAHEYEMPIGQINSTSIGSYWNRESLDNHVINFGQELIEDESILPNQKHLIEQIVERAKRGYSKMTEGSVTDQYNLDETRLWLNYVDTKAPLVQR